MMRNGRARGGACVQVGRMERLLHAGKKVGLFRCEVTNRLDPSPCSPQYRNCHRLGLKTEINAISFKINPEDNGITVVTEAVQVHLHVILVQELVVSR